MELIQETEIPHVVNPRTLLPENPVWVINQKIKYAGELPSYATYKPGSISKCGLGQTQGTKGQFRGMSLDSYWEAAFYIWVVDVRGGTCTRNTTESFYYINSEGKEARFFPDFKTSEFGFAEVKGRFRPDDLLKRDATAGVVTFFDSEKMKPIMKEVNKFNPNWREEYSQVSIPIKYKRS